ncbi:MltA-interacting protein MipA [Roseibium album]|nr:MltA-interacting protein MipA [Roseibium album]
MSSKCYVQALLVASLGVLCSAAAAEESKDWSIFVGGGGFYVPEYLGSDDYTFAPALIGTIQKGPYFIKFNGTQATANILPYESFYAGPLVGFGMGRKDVSDKVVKKLPEVDNELWVGAAVGGGYAGLMLQRDNIGAGIEVAHDVLGGSGTTATFNIGYEVNATERLAFGVDLSTTFADGTYADTYYSISAKGAAASGLKQYKADAGFRDVSVDLSSRYAFTEKWGVGGVVGGSVLLGDFADSPIVKERGQRANGRGGLFLWYRF